MEKEGRDKSRGWLLHCRTLAGPGAVVLTTTDGTDPDGHAALDATLCKLVYSGTSLGFFVLVWFAFFKLLIVTA